MVKLFISHESGDFDFLGGVGGGGGGTFGCVLCCVTEYVEPFLMT